MAKFHVAYVVKEQTYIVFTGSQIIEKDLSEDAATALAQFLNSQSYLNTDPKARSVRPQPLPSFDFEAVYKIFPRRIGKKTGIEKLRKTVTTQDKYELLVQAAQHYAHMMRDTEEKYVKHFSSWATCWMDWIPEDATVSSQPEQMDLDDISRLLDN
jgi:hypothetical protein